MSLAALIAAVSLAASPVPAAAPASAAAGATPGHVWTIVLENKDYETTFGADSKAPYLAHELSAQGALLTNYYGTAHHSLPNYIAMVSGQAANPITQADCQLYQEFIPGAIGANGQAVGQGCIYPSQVKTVADQLVAKGLRYRGYMEDMGDDPARENLTCAHPAIGGQDNTQGATAMDQYATRHNPFMYFHSIIDDQPSCDQNVVNLDRLDDDLRSATLTPEYSFITPDLCSDGHDATCADSTQKGGYDGIDEFLQKWVPKITASAAFQQDGLLIITFDEAEADNTACCDEQAGPNTPSPGIQGPGGGRVGAVLLSPLVKPGTTIETPINHYGYLRSIEDTFGLEPLGYAAQDGLATFAAMNLFSRTPPATHPPKAVKRFRVTRKGKRLTIRVSLAAGVVGRIAVVRHGKVVKRFTTGGRATLHVKVRRKAKVVLRARRNGKTVKTLTKRR